MRFTDQATLALLALVCYAFSRVAVDSFYSRLGGLTPREAGLSYLTIIEPAAFLFGAAVLLTTIIAFFIQSLARYKPAARVMGKILLSILALAIVLSVILYILKGRRGYVIGALIVVGWGTVRAALAQLVSLLRRTRPSRRMTMFVGATPAVMVLGLALFGAHEYGVYEANRVKNGHVAHPTYFGITVSSIKAAPVTLSWIIKPTSEVTALSTQPGCLIRVGFNDSRLALYDLTTGRVTSVPSENAVISESAPNRTCKR